MLWGRVKEIGILKHESTRYLMEELDTRTQGYAVEDLIVGKSVVTNHKMLDFAGSVGYSLVSSSFLST